MKKEFALSGIGWSPFFEANFNALEDASLTPGRIILAEKNQYQVRTENGEHTAMLAGRIRHHVKDQSEWPVVGDWVALKMNDSETPVIQTVLPRKTLISRKVAGGRKRLSGGRSEEQVIATNMDTLMIVVALDQNYSLRRIERYLTVVYDSGATPVIILNKSDLCDDPESRIQETESVAFGVPVHAISALDPESMNCLNQYLAEGQTIAFLGSSGVGKSTIINDLLGYDRQKVMAISDHVGKGMHTTTTREIIQHPLGGLIMDNPGMRELQLWGDSAYVEGAFQDIELLSENCRFSDCQHKSEPRCAVLAALETSELDEDRYQSYMKLKKELDYQEAKTTKGARVIEKERGKMYASYKKTLAQCNNKH